MLLIIGGLLGVVFYMAHKTAVQPGGATNLPQDTNIPSSGATSRFSPAMTGGTPLVSKANKLRMRTNFTNTRQQRGGSFTQNPQAGSAPGILGGQTNMNWDGGFYRVKPPPTTQPAAYAPNGALIQRFKF